MTNSVNSDIQGGVERSETMSTDEVTAIYREIMSRAPEHDFEPNLDRMNIALDILGHPEQSFRVIHITGTNGKGSTARFCESLVRTYGLRTGLYTSPHLERINERICIDGKPISDERFVETYHELQDVIAMTDKRSLEQGGPRLSFFEVLTLMAICAFADAPVDVAVIEVGMGGMWDATNVLHGDAAIIGPVDMDHMEWLGDTVEQIAETKAGIIKQQSTVIVGPQRHETVLPIIEDYAHNIGASEIFRDGNELQVVQRMPAVGGQVATLQTPRGVYADVPISMFGEHQAHNALAALAACETVIPVSGPLEGDLVEEAFSQVHVPGRIEVVRSAPTIILDGGHNIQAITALTEAIEENFDFTQLVGVVSMMADKQVEETLGILEPVLSHIVITQNSWISRVMPAETLGDIAKKVFGEDRVTVCPLMPDAIETAVHLVDADDEVGVGFGHGILITGSFVTAGDARILLKEQKPRILQQAESLHVDDSDDIDVEDEEFNSKHTDEE